MRKNQVVTDEVLEKMELLAKLNLTEEERKKTRAEMEKILAYVEKLQELDTDGIEPLYSLFPLRNVFREDRAEESGCQEALVKLAPRQKNGQYQVPKTVE